MRPPEQRSPLSAVASNRTHRSRAPIRRKAPKRRKFGDGKPDVITTAVLIYPLRSSMHYFEPNGPLDILPAAFSFRGIRCPSCLTFAAPLPSSELSGSSSRPSSPSRACWGDRCRGVRRIFVWRSFPFLQTIRTKAAAQFVLRVALGWQRCIFAARQPTKRKRIGFEA